MNLNESEDKNMKNIVSCENLKSCRNCIYSSEYIGQCATRKCFMKNADADINQWKSLISVLEKKNRQSEFLINKMTITEEYRERLVLEISERMDLITELNTKIEKLDKEIQLTKYFQLKLFAYESAVNVDDTIKKINDVNENKSIDYLTDLIHEIKLIICEIDKNITSLMDTPIICVQREYKSMLKRRDKDLEVLSERRYIFSQRLGSVEKLLYKKKRAQCKDHSTKALNNGGIYNGPSNLVPNKNFVMGGITL